MADRVSPHPKPRLRLILTGILILAIAAVFLLIAVSVTEGEALFDFTAFWIAGKLTLAGQDPYLSSDWVPVYSTFENLGLQDNQTFLYPKPILPLFIPFGALPLRTAAALWLFLTQAAILGAALLLANLWPHPQARRYLLPFLAGIYLSRSFFNTLSLGQLGGLVLLLLVGVLYLWRKERWLAGGAALSLLMLKPQLGVPVILLVSVWFLMRRMWAHFAGLGLGGAGLLLVGWLLDPAWIGKFIAIGADKVSATFGYHSTLWGLAGFLCERETACTYLSGGLLTALLLGSYLWLLLQKRVPLTAALVLAFSLILSLLITPYLWVYEQLLLALPLGLAIGLLAEKNAPFLLPASLPALHAALTLGLLMAALQIQNDVWSALVPLFALGWMAFAVFRQGWSGV